MPPKKITWGDVPNSTYIKSKDEMKGNWIECGICCVVIKVRATFGFSEWDNHCSSNRHCQKVKEVETSGNQHKLTTYFGVTKEDNKQITSPSHQNHVHKKSKLSIPCPGFNYGKNSELLEIYNKYKKEDSFNESFIIQFQNDVWSTHSNDCSKEAMLTRSSKRADKRACQKCFDFPTIQLVKDRVKRMDRIYHVEQYITEPTASKTGYLEVINFLKTNVSNSSLASKLLRERCLKYISHCDWIKKNTPMLRTYDAIDDDGKVNHQCWLNKVGQMYADEPSIKNSLLHSLMHFTLSRYKGDITAPASPKLISFFQTLHALNPSIYRLFTKNFGGYNERTLKCMAVKQASDVPVINCEPDVIKNRAKNWISQIRQDCPAKLLLVSACADATKVPAIGEFSHKYNAWVGGKYPHHCIDANEYDEEKLITNKLATEIKVGLLSLLEVPDGVSPFKIISARPQSTNESCDSYNSDIMHAVSDLENVHCISIAFDGLSTETNFIRSNLISFMKGNSNTVAMTDCNHAAKNLRSQLVLGSSIVIGGDAAFDVGILRLAGISPELYRVEDYASDVIVLKLCSSDTIFKLLKLIEKGAEDPMNISFMAMTLYFLRTFVCAFNGDDLSSEARITMLWSSLMWFTSLNGIHDKSMNNFSTACIGGVFLAMQKRVKNLRTTTTEPLEHMFGTTRSWKREFTVNEFIIFSNKLEMIMTSIITHGIKTGTSSKGYMTGFGGFANVVSKIKIKLKKERYVPDEISVAVDVNYNKPLSHQIEKGLIGVIGRTQQLILNLMKAFKFVEVSDYCEPISSILDIYSAYKKLKIGLHPLDLPIHDKIDDDKTNEAEVMQRLANLALECNATSNIPNEDNEVDDNLIDEDELLNGVLYDKNGPNHLTLHFDVKMFYKFIGYEICNENVGKMLELMYSSMGTNFEKSKTWGSSTNLQKVKSLTQRWFKASECTIEKLPSKNILGRDYIFSRHGTYFRILCIFKKSYGKWRYEDNADENDAVMAHVQELGFHFESYIQKNKYHCFRLNKDRKYVGTHIVSENRF